MPGTQERPTAVVAIGGNALAPAGEPGTIHDQFRHARESLAPIVALAGAGWNVAVVHGNGPQVGNALLRNERSAAEVPELPLGVLVAATAGWIGYMIQQSLQNALGGGEAEREVVTMITQVVVDAGAPGSLEPRKFIGRALSPQTAEHLRARGVEVAEDDRGRLRRRIPSPPPLRIVESGAIAERVGAGDIVIAAGGGGSPVLRGPDGALEGIDVVIDKDLAASLLASEIRAAILLILTDVDGVYRDFGTPQARRIDRLSVAEARAMVESDQLGSGSMRPKLKAAADFVARGGERAIIAALSDAPQAIAGEAGTVVVPERLEGENG